MRLALAPLLSVLLLSGCSRDDPPAQDGREKVVLKHEVTAFRSYFQSRTGPVSRTDLVEKFGPPTRYGALMIGDWDWQVKPDHSWWGYSIGKDESVTIAVDRGLVGYAFHTYRDARGAMQTEDLRKK